MTYLEVYLWLTESGTFDNLCKEMLKYITKLEFHELGLVQILNYYPIYDKEMSKNKL